MSAKAATRGNHGNTGAGDCSASRPAAATADTTSENQGSPATWLPRRKKMRTAAYRSPRPLVETFSVVLRF